MQLQAVCSDASRLPMLRACLKQRLVTVARAHFVSGASDAHESVEAQEARKEDRPGKRLSMAADSSLRDVERQLLKANLQVKQLLEEVRGHNDTLSVDVSAKTKQVATLFRNVSNAYRIMRQHIE